ncbi:hypothetical protein PBI_SCTP2_187 [Salicola phage SCTP-2]|nr:hypothetical protein PBI_SCTP2_187 [Salicola phage SCTP-2]
MAKKNNTNPYFLTPITENYLDILVMPQIEHSPNDKFWIIEKHYEYRPDKLAKELYGDERYYYAFMLRNMDIIENPIYDFISGIEIRLPSLSAVKNLG